MHLWVYEADASVRHYLLQEEKPHSPYDRPCRFRFSNRYSDFNELELGNKENAEKLVNHYLNDKSKKKLVIGLYTVLCIDEFTSNVFDKFLLGLYYFKVGQREAANSYFSKASNSEYKNYFSDRSKEYIN